MNHFNARRNCTKRAFLLAASIYRQPIKIHIFRGPVRVGLNLTNLTSYVNNITMAKSYSIYEAKARFSEVMRLVQKHARVIITHRGNPIAQILPLDNESTNLAGRIEAFERDGKLAPAPAKRPTWSSLFKKEGALARFIQDRD